MRKTRGSAASGLIILLLVAALIVTLFMLFVRSVGCDEPYENDATIGSYWIEFQVGNSRPECVQPET